MRINRSQTEANPDAYNAQQNFRVKRSSSSLLNHEILRLSVCEKQNITRSIFTRNQKQLCDFFVKYTPSTYSGINLKASIDEKTDEVRLIKSSNKIYFGRVVGNLRNGEGVLIDDKGKIYEGRFEENNKSGHGLEIYPNGNVYIGQFEKNKKHGKGQFYWYNLSPPVKKEALHVEYYDGLWWGGLPDGTGSHQKHTGDIYDGQFKNGLKHGKGEQYFFNGDSYKGQYVNGLPEGFGVYLWGDGSKYQGDFKQGLRSGEGIWISADQKQEYKGQYLMDKKSGYGEYYWFDKGLVYKGNFQNDLRHGFGELFRDGKEEYQGDWVNGKVKNQLNPERSQEFSNRDNSLHRTPSGNKFPSLTKLRPPSSSIVKRIKQSQLNFNKSLSQSKSKSPSTTSKTMLKNTLVLTRSNNTLSVQKSFKRRPISVHRPVATLPIPKYELLVKKCTKKNCGCNVSIPLNIKNKKVHSHINKHINSHDFH